MSDLLLRILDISSTSFVMGYIILGLAFIASGLTFVPRSAICFVGGLTFGFAALPAAFLASLAGAMLAFLATRSFGRQRYERVLNKRPRLRAVASAVDMEGWKVVGLVRLGAPIPGVVTNYLFGVTRIGLVPYSLATLVGTAPQILTFVYAGVVGQAAVASPSISTAEIVRLTLGFVVLAAGTWFLARRVKRNFSQIISKYDFGQEREAAE
jgi:uncharacterized membrane protein YdjX (TVP38/TMEM64 family)